MNPILRVWDRRVAGGVKTDDITPDERTGGGCAVNAKAGAAIAADHVAGPDRSAAKNVAGTGAPELDSFPGIWEAGVTRSIGADQVSLHRVCS